MIRRLSKINSFKFNIFSKQRGKIAKILSFTGCGINNIENVAINILNQGL